MVEIPPAHHRPMVGGGWVVDPPPPPPAPPDDRPLTLALVLEALEAMGVSHALDEDGVLVFDPPLLPVAEAVVGPWRLLLAWDRVGLASGHAWAPCDVCGEAVMQPRTGGRRCFITPNCPGTHRPPVGRPTPLQAVRTGLVTLDDVRRHPPELGVVLRRLLVGSGEPALTRSRPPSVLVRLRPVCPNVGPLCQTNQPEAR